MLAGDPLQLISREGRSTCPLCRDVLGDAALQACDVCGTTYHAECVAEVGCAVLGCAAARTPSATTATSLTAASMKAGLELPRVIEPVYRPSGYTYGIVAVFAGGYLAVMGLAAAGAAVQLFLDGRVLAIGWPLTIAYALAVAARWVVAATGYVERIELDLSGVTFVVRSLGMSWPWRYGPDDVEQCSGRPSSTLESRGQAQPFYMLFLRRGSSEKFLLETDERSGEEVVATLNAWRERMREEGRTGRAPASPVWRRLLGAVAASMALTLLAALWHWLR